MGDWMGSCVDVKLGDGMGHFGQMTEMVISFRSNDRNAASPKLI